MARARLGLAEAVNEILERRGERGRKLSLRQAERLTGLAPRHHWRAGERQRPDAGNGAPLRARHGRRPPAPDAACRIRAR